MILILTSSVSPGPVVVPENRNASSCSMLNVTPSPTFKGIFSELRSQLHGPKKGPVTQPEALLDVVSWLSQKKTGRILFFMKYTGCEK